MNTTNVRTLGSQNIHSSIWYSFTVPHSAKRLCITEADGIMLTDSNGKKYYDAVSGLWNTALGYSVPSITEAITEQSKKLQYCSLFEHTTPIAEKAANILLSNTDSSMQKVIWGCTGSESIECAIKLMRGYQKSAGFIRRTVILSFSESYHGTHYGALSISGLERKAAEEIAPVLSDVIFLSPAYELDTTEEIIEKTELAVKTIMDSSDKIAGIVIEPVLASAGVKTVNSQFLQRLCNCCREYDIPVTFDEITTGFYRTGSRYRFQDINIIPNILCLSKAINNGCLPLSAVVVGEEICSRFQDNIWTLQHGTTQGGNLVALAALVATDREFELLAQNENLPLKADGFFNVISDMARKYDYIENVRNNGFMYSIVLKKERCAGANDIKAITDKIKHMGVLVCPAEMGFTLMPCLCTNSEQWHAIIGIIDKALEHFS